MTRIVLCGKGRLGGLISAALHDRQLPHEFARIDAAHGLLQQGQPMTGDLEILILCLVPKHEEGRSGWQGLLKGILQQVQSGELCIQRELFVSSTSVYEGIGTGFVEAHTPVVPASARSQGLLEAEHLVTQLSANTVIYRLTGLVGPGYSKYDPLTYSHDKPRQAVDIRAVATAVAESIEHPVSGHRIEILTDGRIYWQGRVLDVIRDAAECNMLAGRYRLLTPSRVVL